MTQRIAFDLDETLGTPILANDSIVGFQYRTGGSDLLERLSRTFTLCLWTVSSRRYLDQILSFGLDRYFKETYSWDELPCTWKDIRKIRVEYLIDDSPEHRDAARIHGLSDRYLVVPAFGCREDNLDPKRWVRLIEEFLSPPD